MKLRENSQEAISEANYDVYLKMKHKLSLGEISLPYSDKGIRILTINN